LKRIFGKPFHLFGGSTEELYFSGSGCSGTAYVPPKPSFSDEHYFATTKDDKLIFWLPPDGTDQIVNAYTSTMDFLGNCTDVAPNSILSRAAEPFDSGYVPPYWLRRGPSALSASMVLIPALSPAGEILLLGGFVLLALITLLRRGKT